jgi:hypothetical protein
MQHGKEGIHRAREAKKYARLFDKGKNETWRNVVLDFDAGAWQNPAG